LNSSPKISLLFNLIAIQAIIYILKEKREKRKKKKKKKIVNWWWPVGAC
jgi:preprotein translocase subunit YajC